MKTRLLTLAFAALCSLLFSRNAAAQGCALTLTPHYSQYVSRSLDSSDNIYQTVELDGYADVGISATCHMSTAVHHPTIYNSIGSQGGSSSGPGACASCYVSYSTTLAFPGVPGIVYPAETDSSMVCTIAGVFFTIGPIIYNIHIGISNYILENWDSANCYYLIFCPNGINAASCPTPVTITDLGGMLLTTPCNQYNYVHDHKLVVNYECFPVGVVHYANFPINCQ